MITIEDAKYQCNIDVSSVEFDPWFCRTIKAAESTIQAQLNRQLHADQAALDSAIAADATHNGMVINEDLKHAMYMLVAHWFENREAASALTIKQVPFSVEMLIEPYRMYSV